MFKLSILSAAVVAASSFFSVSSNANAIERITVTANKLEQKVSDVAASVVVIDRAEIERSGVRDLASLLNQEAGFQINRNGGLGQNAGVALRGASTRHALILIDGVRVGSATLGYKSLEDIPLANIEKVEVIKGSRAAVYGSDALAGVINITTRQAISTVIGFGVGSDKYRTAELATGMRNEAWNVHFTAGLEQADGFDALQSIQFDEDGYQNVNLALGVGYSHDDLGQINVKLQNSQGENEYDSAFGSLDATQYRNEFDNELYALTWQKTINDVSLNLNLNRSTDAFDNIGEGEPSRFDTTRTVKELTASMPLLEQQLTVLVGVNKNNDDISASSNNYALKHRSTQAVFVGGTYEQGNVSLETFVRLEDDDQFGSELIYTVGAGYRVHQEVTFYATQSTGFKAPTFNDLYYPRSGNPNLKPEQSRHNELGVKGQLRDVTFETALFNTTYENKIAWAPNASGNWQPANINEARHQGAELTVKHSLLGFDSSWNYSYLDAKDTANGSEISFNAKNTFNWRVARQFAALEVATELQYRGERQGKYGELPAYTLFNVVANYQLNKELELTFRIENLFDREYNAVDAGKKDGAVFYYNTPERRAYLNLRTRF